MRWTTRLGSARRLASQSRRPGVPVMKKRPSTSSIQISIRRGQPGVPARGRDVHRSDRRRVRRGRHPWRQRTTPNILGATHRRVRTVNLTCAFLVDISGYNLPPVSSETSGHLSRSHRSVFSTRGHLSGGSRWRAAWTQASLPRRRSRCRFRGGEACRPRSFSCRHERRRHRSAADGYVQVASTPRFSPAQRRTSTRQRAALWPIWSVVSTGNGGTVDIYTTTQTDLAADVVGQLLGTAMPRGRKPVCSCRSQRRGNWKLGWHQLFRPDHVSTYHRWRTHEQPFHRGGHRPRIRASSRTLTPHQCRCYCWKARIRRGRQHRTL